MEQTAFELKYYYYYLLSFPILLFFMTRRRPKRPFNLPPSPYALPIIGNFLNLYGKKPHIALTNLAESLGPLISLKFGSKLVIVASTPTIAREIFKFHDRELSGRSLGHVVSLIPSLKTSMVAIAAECDERWRYLRGLSHTALFSSQALELKSQIRRQKIKDMLEYLSMKDGEQVKIADVIFATMANTLTTLMVSRDITSWTNVDNMKKQVEKLLQFAIPGVGDFYPGLVGLDFGSKRKVRVYLESSRTLWGDIIRERRGKKDVDDSHKPDYLDVLIQHSWDDDQICNILTEFFLSAGTLTTSMEWAMAEVTRNPKAFSKLRDELKGLSNNNKEELSDLGKLPYLQAFIKETFRLHPPTPFLVPRLALQTCKITNYDVPKNSMIIVNAYAIGRDPNTWGEDPLVFRPERFLDSGIDLKGTNYELVPFGSGRRICAGLTLAIKLVHLVIASLVLEFDWCLPPGTHPSTIDMTEEFGITLRMANSLTLIPRKPMDVLQKHG